MGYFSQISFYHECGHTERCLWHTNTWLPEDPIPQIVAYHLPPIDHNRVLGDAEEDLNGSTYETHYQNGLCGYCSGAIDHVPGSVKLISEAEKLERRLLWRSVVDECQPMPLILAFVHHSVMSEVIARQAQLEFRMQQAMQMARGEARGGGDELMLVARELREVNQTRTGLAWHQARFQSFIELHAEHILDGVSLTERLHLIRPGWDSDLFAVVDLHTIKDGEECSICLDNLTANNARVRRLPCGHVFHRDCIRPWFADATHYTRCPYCREAYRISTFSSVSR